MNDYFYCIAECDCINKGKLQKVTQIKFEICKNTSRDCTCRYRIKDITYFDTMIFKKIERHYEGRGDKFF